MGVSYLADGTGVIVTGPAGTDEQGQECVSVFRLAPTETHEAASVFATLDEAKAAKAASTPGEASTVDPKDAEISALKEQLAQLQGGGSSAGV